MPHPWPTVHAVFCPEQTSAPHWQGTVLGAVEEVLMHCAAPTCGTLDVTVTLLMAELLLLVSRVLTDVLNAASPEKVDSVCTAAAAAVSEVYCAVYVMTMSPTARRRARDVAALKVQTTLTPDEPLEADASNVEPGARPV